MTQQKRKLIEIQRDLILARNSYEELDEEQYLLDVYELAKELYDKEDGIYNYYKFLQSEIDRAKEAKNKVDRYIKTQTRASEGVKQYVLRVYEELGQLPHSSEFNPIAISESAGSVDIWDVNKIPEEYFRKKIIVEPDKKKILEDLRAGKEISGARLEKKPYVRGIK